MIAIIIVAAPPLPGGSSGSRLEPLARASPHSHIYDIYIYMYIYMYRYIYIYIRIHIYIYIYCVMYMYIYIYMYCAVRPPRRRQACHFRKIVRLQRLRKDLRTGSISPDPSPPQGARPLLGAEEGRQQVAHIVNYCSCFAVMVGALWVRKPLLVRSVRGFLPDQFKEYSFNIQNP